MPECGCLEIRAARRQEAIVLWAWNSPPPAHHLGNLDSRRRLEHLNCDSNHIEPVLLAGPPVGTRTTANTKCCSALRRACAVPSRKLGFGVRGKQVLDLNSACGSTAFARAPRDLGGRICAGSSHVLGR
jgi:hypothetical protein